jgi:parallel beta-helix repeat protein
MDKNHLLGKGLAVAIIFLFMGMIFPLSIVRGIEEHFLMGNDDRTDFYFLGKKIYVDDNNIAGPWEGTEAHPYQFIIDGVNVAGLGDVVFVHTGNYNTDTITITKPMKIEGEARDSTSIDFNGNYECFIIQSNFVTIQNFTIYQSGVALLGSMIYIRGNFNVISNNNLGRNCSYTTSYAILCEANNNFIFDNIINNVWHGIYCYFSMNNVIHDNQIKTTHDGIELIESSRNLIYCNTVSCPQDIDLQSSRSNFIINNNFLGGPPYFINAIIPPFNHWIGNYWNGVYTNPKPIQGEIVFRYHTNSWVDYDFHPKKHPNV